MTIWRVPCFLGNCPVTVEIRGVPRESFAKCPPIDPELATDLFFTTVPRTRLEILNDRNIPAACKRAQHDAKCSGRLALAIAGVDEKQRLDVPDLARVWSLCGGRVNRRFVGCQAMQHITYRQWFGWLQSVSASRIHSTTQNTDHTRRLHRVHGHAYSPSPNPAIISPS